MLTSEPVKCASAPPEDCDFSPKALLSDPAHIQRIEQIARKQTRGSTIDWEDARQAAQTKLLKVIDQGKFRQGDRDGFYRWAMTVAKYEIIDLVRKEQRHCCRSLDQPIADSDLTWVDTVADPLDAFDSVAQAELVMQVRTAIATLDRQYPHKQFRALWQAYLKGQNQTELAATLGISQSAVSKRWKEFVQRMGEQLGVMAPEIVVRRTRRRSPQTW
jgi:RNA polymerase sigma factor (sigma-70 family)